MLITQLFFENLKTAFLISLRLCVFLLGSPSSSRHDFKFPIHPLVALSFGSCGTKAGLGQEDRKPGLEFGQPS